MNNQENQIKIVTYEPAYKEDFKSLSVKWISYYFEIEPDDYISLDHPQENIIDKGEEIFIALLEDEPVGVCAMLKLDNGDFDYRMAKMAVSPKVQGKGIGYLLGEAGIEWAKARGASKIYLESNTILKPAINLYYKLGFQEIKGLISPYKRVNVFMALELPKKKL